MKVKEITLNEVANNPYDYELDQDGAQFIDKDGNSYSIKFIRIESGVFAVAFSSGIFVDQKTNRHDSFRIFATVIDVIKSYATKNQVAMIVFSANKSEPNRVNLYKKLALAFTRNSNYKLIDHSKEITDNTLKDRIQYLFWYLKTKDFTPFMLVNRKFTSENISEKQNQKYNDLDEGWKDQLFGLGLAGAVAAGSTGVMTAKQALTSPNQTKPAAAVAQNTQPAKPQLKPAQPTAPAKVVEPTVNYITNTPLEKYLMTYAAKAGLRGYELAQFMAQCAHETQDFSRLAERGGLKYFRKYDPKYAPQKAKLLGNTKVGDGARFKGRGFIQLTGRYNYGVAGKAIGQDLIKNPQLAEDPKIAAQIALWYWQNRVKPSVDDYKNTTDVTRKINPGLKGLEDRHENFIEYIAGDETDNKNVNEQGVAEGSEQDIPEFLYHATYRPLLKSIKQHGLGGDKAQAKWEDSKPGVVYLATDPNVAESYAETSDVVPDEWLDQIVILKISTNGLENKIQIDKNVQDNEGDTLEYHGIIPLSNISMYKQGVTEGSYKEGGSITHDGVEYDFDKVLAIAETKPTKQCSVSKLAWVLAYDEPDTTRLKNADISVPVVITKSNNGKLTVIDGLHRLAKAVDSNIKSLPVKYITSGELQSARLKQSVAEGYSNTTFQTERRRLNVPALIKAGALFVTYPHGEQGWETDNQEDWAYSLISLYNVMKGGWPAEAKKYLKPASYKKAEQQINSSAPNLGSNKLVYDGKYNQILWSIKKLGIPNNVAFLDNDNQGVAEGFIDKFFKPKKVKPEMIMNIKKGNGELYVEVYMGEDSTYWIARFTFDMIGDTLTAQDISVTDEYRGRGIAKWVYDTLKNKGYTINRSPYQTDDGKHFWDKNKGVNAKVWEQGVAEDFEGITEMRGRMYQFIKSVLPKWPDYVVKDWIYTAVGKNKDYSNNGQWIKNNVQEIINDIGLSENTNWQLIPNMKFTMDMWEPRTKQKLIGRAGGKSDLGMGVPRDAERHATQAQLAQQQGGIRKEPVIIVKTSQGYELLEGWHRTIQHFAKYPDGYTGPAYVAVAQNQQGVAEAKYAGNIGIMELIKFFQTHPELKSEYNEIKREKGAIEAMNFALDAINAELEGEPYSVAEDQTEDDNITVQNNVETSFRGGYGGTLIAKTPDRQVGYLNYSIYNDKPQIGMIFVAQDYRRRGVAMKMLKALQELSPNEEIDWGITTDAGSNLRKSINYRKVPNPEIIKKKAKLAGVRSKLARLNYRLEQLKNTDVELARKFIKTVGDRWNQLNDLEYRLENELYLDKGEYSKLIPETK